VREFVAETADLVATGKVAIWIDGALLIAKLVQDPLQRTKAVEVFDR
jgi:hypothetical protein